MAAEIRRQRPAVVINTIGPFTATAPPVVGACLEASDYVDLANDVAAVSALLDMNAAAAAAGRTLVTGGGFGVTATESVVVRLCEGRPAPARVRVDMVPSLEMEAGTIGAALAGTILEGLPGIEGGGRYQGRRYAGGRLGRPGSAATRFASPCRTAPSSRPRGCRSASSSRPSGPAGRRP